ncbi:MAG TPA: hypothetical protein PKM73_09140 [Verrucomicrobiota bacterium]|nr:hypothetical protein [Verrucomicrobiota bacterium]HNU51970.1 hypothetical protein [Verrucomicrobiota bacterium]
MAFSRKTFVIAVLVAAFIALVRLLAPNDEARIRKLLDTLAREASVPAQGKPVTDLAAANRLANLFAPGLQIQINLAGAPDVSVGSRTELVQLTLTAKSHASPFTVDLLDPRIFNLGSTSAVVDATARATVSGEPDPVVAELRFHLVKVEARWRVQSVQNTPTFE